MNASLLVSVTAVVLCVAITIAVYFALASDDAAATYNYRVGFSTSMLNDAGEEVRSGSGTIVVNEGTQSFIYTDGNEVTVQESSGLTFGSSDGGNSWSCAGNVGGLNYASATPQAVAGSLSEFPDDDGLVCGGKKMHTISAFGTIYWICSEDDGTPVSVHGDNFETTVTSWEVDKNNAFDSVKVNSDNVNVELCEYHEMPIEICALDTKDMLGPTFETSPQCCNALGNWVRNQVDGDDMEACNAFEACFGACHSFTGNFIAKMQTEAEIADAVSTFDGWCATQDATELAASCSASQRKLTTPKHWRERSLATGSEVEMVQANPGSISPIVEEQMEHRRENQARNRERVRRINRRNLVAKHGDDFHRTLGEEEAERRLNQVRVCMMHGMGAQDDSGGDNTDKYWGVPSFRGADTEYFYIQTNSKYCNYKNNDVCTGEVPWDAKDTNGPTDANGGTGAQIKWERNGVSEANCFCWDGSRDCWNMNGDGKCHRDPGDRGSLPNQFKWFIDENQCNTIFAHSMGNPTMHQVWAAHGDDYQWYDTNGPKRGSTAAGVVTTYCNQGFWDYFSFSGMTNILMEAVSTGMGYCSSGRKAHNALLSMVPSNTNKWWSRRGHCIPAFTWVNPFSVMAIVGNVALNQIIQGGGGAANDAGGPDCVVSREVGSGDCTLSQSAGCGAHYVRYSEREHWFEMEVGRRNEDRGCSGWSWFVCVGRIIVEVITFEWACQQDAQCEDSGESKIANFRNHGGIIGAMCGKGVGYGLGHDMVGENGEVVGGTSNIGLKAIHAITDYGELSDGMVGYSSCVIPGRESQFVNTYTRHFYYSDQSHQDGTCLFGDLPNNGQKPCKWFVEMADAGGCNPQDYRYERNGYCNSWANGSRAYCTYHRISTRDWVRAQCPCSCAGKF